MTDIPDVDIEVADPEGVLALFPTAIRASQQANHNLVPHKTGIYFQRIPINPLNGVASFPKPIAEEFGFYAIDLLTIPYPYGPIESRSNLIRLLDDPIDWKWFLSVDFVRTLFQLKGEVNHELSVADVVTAYAPTSVQDLACLIAIIRPGKKHLIGTDWETIRSEIWKKEPERGRFFKKSHAIAYALVVALDARLKAQEHFYGTQTETT